MQSLCAGEYVEYDVGHLSSISCRAAAQFRIALYRFTFAKRATSLHMSLVEVSGWFHFLSDFAERGVFIADGGAVQGNPKAGFGLYSLPKDENKAGPLRQTSQSQTHLTRQSMLQGYQSSEWACNGHLLHSTLM